MNIFSTSHCGPVDPGKHLRQSPQTREPFLVDVQVSNAELLAYHGSKTETKTQEFGHIGENKRKSLTSPALPLLWGKQLRDKRDRSSQLLTPHREKWEYVSETLLPPLWRILPENPKSHLLPPDYWIMSCMTGDWCGEDGGKRLGEQKIGLSKGIEGVHILLTALWTPSRCPPGSFWRLLVHGSPYQPMGTPCALHTTHTLCGWLPVHTLSGGEDELWHLVSMDRKLARSC